MPGVSTQIQDEGATHSVTHSAGKTSADAESDHGNKDSLVDRSASTSHSQKEEPATEEKVNPVNDGPYLEATSKTAEDDHEARLESATALLGLLVPGGVSSPTSHKKSKVERKSSLSSAERKTTGRARSIPERWTSPVAVPKKHKAKVEAVKSGSHRRTVLPLKKNAASSSKLNSAEATISLVSKMSKHHRDSSSSDVLNQATHKQDRRKSASSEVTAVGLTREKIVRIVTGRPPRRQAATLAMTKLATPLILESNEPPSTRKVVQSSEETTAKKKSSAATEDIEFNDEEHAAKSVEPGAKRKAMQSSAEPTAKKKRTIAKKSSAATDDNEFNDEEHAAKSGEPGVSKKRKAVQSSTAKKRTAVADDNTFSGRERAVKSENGAGDPKKVSFKNSLPGHWDLSKINRLKPIVDNVDFDEMVEQVKIEFADLCQPEELRKEGLPNSGSVKDSDSRFETGFVDFLAFRKIYGHAIVPKIFPERPSLGRWTQFVRRWRTRKDETRLTPSRRRRLDEVGFVWDAKSHPDYKIVQGTVKQVDEHWEKMFQTLLEYKAKNGHCNVPKEKHFEEVPAVCSCCLVVLFRDLVVFSSN
jgi:Helicase associated domain